MTMSQTYAGAVDSDIDDCSCWVVYCPVGHGTALQYPGVIRSDCEWEHREWVSPAATRAKVSDWGPGKGGGPSVWTTDD